MNRKNRTSPVLHDLSLNFADRRTDRVEGLYDSFSTHAAAHPVRFSTYNPSLMHRRRNFNYPQS
jgi:hypothetical protein